MAYTDELAKLSRTPCQLVSISMIHCGLTFGTAPCVATGNHCYQTYNTCKDKSHFGWSNTVNLLDNGDFKTINGWVTPTSLGLCAGSTLELSTGGIEGRCAKAMQSVSTASFNCISYAYPFEIGATYTLKAWVKADSTYDVVVGIGAFGVTWTTMTSIEANTSWTEVTLPVTPDVQTKAIVITCLWSTITGNLYVDNVSLTGQYGPSIPLKEYKYTSVDVPLPLRTGERPYLKKVKHLPVEIKDNITVSGRVNIELYDEPDADYDLDPNYAARGAGYSTNALGKSYFRKLFARYDNWYNRTLEVYEGFSVATNLSTANFARKFVGTIKEVNISGNIVKIEAVDVLQGLKDISYPQECEVELKNNMSAAATQIKVKDFGDLPSTGGYLKIEDEIVKYATVAVVQGQTFNPFTGLTIPSGKPSKLLRGVTRGMFQTTATSHDKKTKGQLCKLMGPSNPFDIMQDILFTHASMAATSIDTAAFEALKTYPGRECKFVTLMTQPEDLNKLYEELLERTECRSWVDENQQITIGRGFLNNTTVVWAEITASAHIIEGSEDMSMNVEDGITHGLLYWDKSAIADDDKSSGFSRVSVQTDTAIESNYYHGKRVDVEIYDRWLHTSLSYPASQVGESSVVAAVTTVTTNLYDPANVEVYADGMIARYVNWRAPDRKRYTISLEMKDSTIAAGQQVLFNSDLFLDASGMALQRVRCFISKKEEADFEQELTLEDYGKWTALIAPDGYPDFSSSLSASALVYGFMSDTNGNMGNGTPGYVIY